MNVVCVQIDPVWENKSANHEKIARLLEAAKPPKDSLIVIAEMFATGFSMNATKITDSGNHETYNFLSQLAKTYSANVMGGLVTTDASGKGRNECVVFSPDGSELARYCKLHPFTLGGELANFVKGEKIVTFDLHGFTIAPFICYDLRFPEVFRIASHRGANLITVIASWPARRHQHWVKLLQARAIENQAYVIGVNRCGLDAENLVHDGQSMIIAPSGEILLEAGNTEATISAEIQVEEVLEYREKLPFLRDLRTEFFADAQ